jgi:hypothetical protein
MDLRFDEPASMPTKALPSPFVIPSVAEGPAVR